ncbi:hypothetical protein FQR65_LT00572 [Abscondita terminalis]|nr:hypothetical protein FQR65_LT00572 [Abscondita terminalis]
MKHDSHFYLTLVGVSYAEKNMDDQVSPKVKSAVLFFNNLNKNVNIDVKPAIAVKPVVKRKIQAKHVLLESKLKIIESERNRETSVIKSKNVVHEDVFVESGVSSAVLRSSESKNKVPVSVIQEEDIVKGNYRKLIVSDLNNERYAAIFLLMINCMQ